MKDHDQQWRWYKNWVLPNFSLRIENFQEQYQVKESNDEKAFFKVNINAYVQLRNHGCLLEMKELPLIGITETIINGEIVKIKGLKFSRTSYLEKVSY